MRDRQTRLDFESKESVIGGSRSRARRQLFAFHSSTFLAGRCLLRIMDWDDDYDYYNDGYYGYDDDWGGESAGDTIGRRK